VDISTVAGVDVTTYGVVVDSEICRLSREDSSVLRVWALGNEVYKKKG
jgi:hypothetical protein